MHSEGEEAVVDPIPDTRYPIPDTRSMPWKAAAILHAWPMTIRNASLKALH